MLLIPMKFFQTPVFLLQKSFFAIKRREFEKISWGLVTQKTNLLYYFKYQSRYHFMELEER